MGQIKTIKGKVAHKHETEADWLLSSYVPDAGEIIVYDEDINYNYPRFKVGDGDKIVKDLPFVQEQSDWNQTDSTKTSYIKNKLSLNNGISEDSLAQNSAKAGRFGFRYLSMTKDTNANTTTFVLESDENLTSIFQGKECSIITNSFYDLYGTPSSVSYSNGHTVLVFSGTTFDEIEPDLVKDPHKKTISIPSEPELGDTDIGFYAVAFGIESEALGLYSFAEGGESKALSAYAHAEGRETQAMYSAHAEGRETQALGLYSHAEGQKTIAGTKAGSHGAHAEGRLTKAEGEGSHAEGHGTNSQYNYAKGVGSHVEGNVTTANGVGAHAEGVRTQATGSSAHAEGHYTKADGTGAHAEGFADSNGAIVASGYGAHAEGVRSSAYGSGAHSEGQATKAGTSASPVIGAHAEGINTSAIEDAAHAEGQGGAASNTAAHAEGHTTNASGVGAHAEGVRTYAYSQAAHSEGSNTSAHGHSSHAEGYNSKAGAINASDNSAPVPNTSATTIGFFAHAEGNGSWAKGNSSHAEGWGTIASGLASHASGIGTIANGEAQTVIGKYNKELIDRLFIVGNGTGPKTENRDNVFEITKEGNCLVKGRIMEQGQYLNDKYATKDQQGFVDKAKSVKSPLKININNESALSYDGSNEQVLNITPESLNALSLSGGKVDGEVEVTSLKIGGHVLNAERLAKLLDFIDSIMD